MRKKSNFFERLIEYAENQGIKNANDLAERLGYASPEKLYRLKRKPEARPSVEILEDISNLFENLNLRWLITGVGSPSILKVDYTPPAISEEISSKQGEKSSTPTHKVAKKGTIVSPTTSKIVSPTVSPTRNLGLPMVVVTDEKGNENVVFVPVRARAGYLAGFGDIEYIQELPTYRLPGLSEATHRAFEVEGHSMVPTLHAHDIVVGEWVESLDHIRDDRVYILVTTEGILVKRVLNRIEKHGFLLAKSDTVHNRDQYPALQIAPDQVLECWYARMYLSSDFRAPAEVYHRINDLEAEVAHIKKKLDI